MHSLCYFRKEGKLLQLFHKWNGPFSGLVFQTTICPLHFKTFWSFWNKPNFQAVCWDFLVLLWMSICLLILSALLFTVFRSDWRQQMPFWTLWNFQSKILRERYGVFVNCSTTFFLTHFPWYCLDINVTDHILLGGT